jgi:predicted nuclease with TOPRIM domain
MTSGDNPIRKMGAESNIFSKLSKCNKDVDYNVYAFYLDSIIFNKNNTIRVFDKETFKESDISVKEAISNVNVLKNYELKKGMKKSYCNFLSNNGNLDAYAKEFLDTIVKLSKNLKNKIVLVTAANDDNKLLKEIIINKIEDSYGIRCFCGDIDVLYMDNKVSKKNILNALGQRYLTRNIQLHYSKIDKHAGVSVPEGTKSTAEDCADKFEKAIEHLKTLTNNLEHNQKEYEKIQDNEDLIRKTKGKYGQSAKKNKKIIERALTNILNGIRDMNKIKDVSTTMDLIDSVATSSKECADYIQKVFDLLEKVGEKDFSVILFGSTSDAINSISDTIETLKRIRQYIFKDIIGIIPISE